MLTHITLFLFQIEDTRVTESGHLEYYLEYIDYPEEGEHVLMLAIFFLYTFFSFA
jgi:hypothetical protein